MKIRPIRTQDDYREALASVDVLWPSAEPGTDAGDQLDVLITLIQAYEREHHPILPPDPVEAIKFRIDQMGIGKKGLEGILGRRARVAEVLSRARALSIATIRKLHHQLGIPAEILIQEMTPASKLKQQAARKTVKTSAKKGTKSAKPQTPRASRSKKRAA